MSTGVEILGAKLAIFVLYDTKTDESPLSLVAPAPAQKRFRNSWRHSTVYVYGSFFFIILAVNDKILFELTDDR